MSSRITSGLKGLEAFERDYLLLQLGKMERSNHWTHSYRCGVHGC